MRAKKLDSHLDCINIVNVKVFFAIIKVSDQNVNFQSLRFLIIWLNNNNCSNSNSNSK
jgi:hypothetical protein